MNLPSFCSVVSAALFVLLIVPAASYSSQRQVIEQNFQLVVKTKHCPSCDLTGVDFTRVNLAGAELEGANLAGARFYLANLSGANLKNANLQGAALGGADLADADLRGANLTGAVLEGAYLKGARMENVIILEDPPAKPTASRLESSRVSGKAPVGKDPSGKDVTIGKRRDFDETPPVVVSGANFEPKKNASPEVSGSNSEPDDTGKRRSGVKPSSVSSKEDTLKHSKKMVRIADVVFDNGMMQDEVASAMGAGGVGKAAVVSAASDDSGQGSPVAPSDVEKEVAESGFWEKIAGLVKKVSNPEAADVSVPGQAKDTGKMEVTKDQAGVTTPDPGAPFVRLKMEPVEGQDLLVKILEATNRCVACNLSGVDLSGVDLDKADLERANLEGALLAGADLRGANLKGVLMKGADLKNADLREADLYRADLSGTDLSGARFDGALVDLADFSNARGVNLDGAVKDE